MKFKEPKNSNYCALIAKIDAVVDLPNCDNVKHGIVLGNKIIVNKSTNVGDIGVYFPVETQLSPAYLKANNLYRKKELNSDPLLSGYFEENGRVRCAKFRTHYESNGIFMPLESLSFCLSKLDGLEIGDAFDAIGDTAICSKYVIKSRAKGNSLMGGKKSKTPKEEKLIDGQFRFHQDTSMMYRNLHKVTPHTIIQMSTKIHGCVDADTIVTTNIGDFTIKEIVNNKMDVLIKALNVHTNEIVFVPIDDYYLLKDDGDWYEIELEDGKKIKITGNNPVWLPELNCYRKVEDLTGDEFLLVS